MEKWKTIEGFPGYSVSSLGNVASVKNHETKLLTPTDNGNEYLQVALANGGKTYRRYVHRLVALAFLSSPEKGFEVNHKDGNRRNNYVSNLEWCTHKRNVRQSSVPKKVYCIETGEIFDSITIAASVAGTSFSNLSCVLNGRSKTAKGCHWRFL